MTLQTIGTPGLWAGFGISVLLMMVLDLGVVHRHAREVKFREAAIWSLVWISFALLFNLLLYFWFGTQIALEFFAGYLVEKSLSVDNLFVFLLIFSYFRVPAVYQHRVLFWGIIGAVLMRAAFIFVGAALIQRFHWILYLFGIILVVSAFKLLKGKHDDIDPENNFVIKLFKKFIPTANNYHGEKFFVREGGKLFATPLCVVLISIEMSDLVFAIDSIPAIFAITTDPFIVFTSNIFAILGLRALYFVLSAALSKLRFLNYGLAAVLGFVGLKMLLIDIYKFHIMISLGFIISALFISVLASVYIPEKASDSDRNL